MAWDTGNAWRPDWHGRWRSHKPGQALVEQNVARPLLRVRNTGTTERLREITVPPEIEVGEGYGKVSWSVRAIWEHYAGWFHHASTTELYSVPATSINADLIDMAGGASALVGRARQKIAQGRLEEAIHLLNIVFTEEPNHQDALTAALDAHELLLASSKNFWLTSWLQNQIDELGARRS